MASGHVAMWLFGYVATWLINRYCLTNTTNRFINVILRSSDAYRLSLGIHNIFLELIRWRRRNRAPHGGLLLRFWESWTRPEIPKS